MRYVVDITRGVPNADVPGIVARLMRNPRYVHHVVLPEGEATSTIVVILRAPGGRKKAKKKTSKKRSRRG